MNDIKARAVRDLSGFRKELAGLGWFWDINKLHDRFRYDRAFTPTDLRRRWARFVKKEGPGGRVPLDLYFHIPFCRSRCGYCLFFRSAFLPPAQVEAYIDLLIARIRYFAPVFKGRRFRHLYVGGGTPSMLSESQLERLLTAVNDNFSFDAGGQRTMETNPVTARGAYFSLLRRFGFNRVSFGVQSLNPAALAANNRGYQSERSIAGAIRLARAAGFDDINADLIAGLAGDTPKGLLYSFARLAEMAPKNIVLYGLMPPSGEYLSNLLKMTRREYFMRHYPGFIARLLPLVTKLADSCGYVSDSPDQARWHWGFRHKAHLGVEMLGGYSGEYSGCILGFGHGAKSRIHNDLEYRELADLAAPSPETSSYEGRLSDRREEMIKFVINRLDQNCSLPRRQFEGIFGETVEDAFPYAVAALRALGRMTEAPEELDFSFKRPEDKYLHALFFFAPQGPVAAGPRGKKI